MYRVLNVDVGLINIHGLDFRLESISKTESGQLVIADSRMIMTKSGQCKIESSGKTFITRNGSFLLQRSNTFLY